MHKLFHSKYYLDVKDKMGECEYCRELFWEKRDKFINPDNPRYDDIHYY